MNKKIHMDIGGMTCISCQNRIEKALYSVNGVRKVKVSYSQGRADIECDENKTDVKKLVRAVEKLDYEVLSAGEKADKGRIGQVLSNLLSNAVKYTDVNGSINVLVKKDVDKAVLVVEDTGIGIAKEDQMRVFERFYLTDKSRTRKTGGAGIGLTITKAIVQAHGGTIHCESEPGEGSRFIVTLPVIDDMMIDRPEIIK